VTLPRLPFKVVAEIYVQPTHAAVVCAENEGVARLTPSRLR
jgi:hypothetical protein